MESIWQSIVEWYQALPPSNQTDVHIAAFFFSLFILLPLAGVLIYGLISLLLGIGRWIVSLFKPRQSEAERLHALMASLIELQKATVAQIPNMQQQALAIMSKTVDTSCSAANRNVEATCAATRHSIDSVCSTAKHNAEIVGGM